jgi:hypothetical protein
MRPPRSVGDAPQRSPKRDPLTCGASASELGGLNIALRVMKQNSEEAAMKKLLLASLVALIGLAPALDAAQARGGGGGAGAGAGGGSGSGGSGGAASGGAAGSGGASGSGAAGGAGSAGGAAGAAGTGTSGGSGAAGSGASGSGSAPSTPSGGSLSQHKTERSCVTAGGMWQATTERCEAKPNR